VTTVDAQIPHPRRGEELQRLLEQERRLEPFLVLRDAEDELRFVVLGAETGRAVVGRAEEVEVPIPWDAGVSRVHCTLERIGPDWAVEDDGISRNGTFVNAQRVQGSRRLRDSDVLRVGRTSLVFRDPRLAAGVGTAHLEDLRPVLLSAMQRKVLVALCRPYMTGKTVVAPPTNAQIAEELVLSLEGVKSHMKALFEKLEVGDLPQGQKRVRVVEHAFQRGLVTRKDG